MVTTAEEAMMTVMLPMAPVCESQDRRPRIAG